MAAFKIGDRIHQYKVNSLLREGLYYETYKVEDMEGQMFFLKLYCIDIVPEELRKKGYPEYVIALNPTIKHPNFAKFVFLSSIATKDHIFMYVVSRFNKGHLLSDLIDAGKQFSEEEAEGIFCQILQALQYLHTHKLKFLLNDITPQNILLTDEGEVKIIDLGHVTSCMDEVVVDPAIEVTDLDFRYLSIETFLNHFSVKTDIFAATAVFYTMLFGTIPWNPILPNGDHIECMDAIMDARKEPREADISGRTLSEKHIELLRKGLCQETCDRYDSVENMLAILSKV